MPAITNWNVKWGTETKQYSAEDLNKGINLAWDFQDNPFCDAFNKVDAAVATKQAYETQQVKKEFHSKERNSDFAAIVARTEAVRQPLADAVATAMQPVTHVIELTPATETE